MISKVEFQPLCKNDLPMLSEWFQLPHVMQWYARGKHYTFNDIRQKYLPRIKDSKNILNYIAYHNNEPVGYIQFYRLTHFLPDGISDSNHLLFETYKPDELVGTDLFVANNNLLGTGFGSDLLNQFVDEYLQGHYRAIVVDPMKDNCRAIRFFEKNGFNIFDGQNQSDNVLLIRKLS